MTFVYSIFRDFTGIVPQGFTLDFYKEIFVGGASLLPALGRTLTIAFGSVLLSLTITLLAVYATSIHFPRLEKILSVVTKIPYSVQGVILAISLITIYANTNTFLADRRFLLVAAYCVIISPYMYQGVRNAMDTVDILPLLESAEVLGAGKLYAFFRIVLPAAKNGLLATSLLCGGLLFGDFVLVNILAGSHLETLAIRLSRVMYYSGNQAAAISSILFLCMCGLSLLVSRLQAGKTERISTLTGKEQL